MRPSRIWLLAVERAREVETVLGDSSQEVSDSLISAGWDFHETPRELDDLDSSDDDE
jgi:hypothetical protein